jgi:hypothetical protein
VFAPAPGQPEFSQAKLDELTRVLKAEPGRFYAQRAQFVLKPMLISEEIQAASKARHHKEYLSLEMLADKRLRFSVSNEQDAADHVMALLGHQFVCCLGQVYFLDVAAHLWRPVVNKLSLAVVKTAVSKIDFVLPNGVVQSRNKVTRDHIAELLMDAVRTDARCQDDQFVRRAHKSTKGKICFQDGVWDGPSRSFKPWSSELLAIVHPLKIVADTFPVDVSQQEVDSMKKQLIYDTFVPPDLDSITDLLMQRQGSAPEADVQQGGGDMRLLDIARCVERTAMADLWWARMSRALHGHAEDKVLSLLHGPRNTGKSLFVILFKNAFGGYVQQLPPKQFEYHSFSSPDVKRNSWLNGLEHCRLVMMMEGPKGKDLQNVVSAPKQLAWRLVGLTPNWLAGDGWHHAEESHGPGRAEDPCKPWRRV